ncbi:MAG TPA: hypothetical protein VEH53_07460 [archaeon]|nr:hypothetical protein [archaeon]
MELGWYVLRIPLGKDVLEDHGLAYRSLPAFPDSRIGESKDAGLPQKPAWLFDA